MVLGRSLDLDRSLKIKMFERKPKTGQSKNTPKHKGTRESHYRHRSSCQGPERRVSFYLLDGIEWGL